jgi:hypothetical protein
MPQPVNVPLSSPGQPLSWPARARVVSISPSLIDATRINISERWESRERLEAFRGSGPEDELSTLILNAEVEELQI